ncbi:MAG: M14 family zinc carboxypeptidase [Saprospiraceae bacterium]
MDYFKHVATNSDRWVQLQEFGRTNEKRPQVLAVISTPENLARIDDIRQNNLRLAGVVDGSPNEANPVAIAWLGFSVHGNEAAGSEASMQVVYELANPANAKTAEWLKNTVVLIEPSVNPDGYSRYTSQYRQASPDEPDPAPRQRAQRALAGWPGEPLLL